MRSLLSPPTSSLRPRHLGVAAVAYLPLAVLMFGPWAGSLSAVRRRCEGLPPFDVRGWWTVEDARTMMSACGPDGRTAYVHQQTLDLVYPAALAVLLVVATGLLLRRHGDRWWPVLLPTLAMTGLDYVENIGVWTVLLDRADAAPAVIALAGAATAGKRLLGFVAFTIPLVLAVVALGSKVRLRTAGRAAR